VVCVYFAYCTLYARRNLDKHKWKNLVCDKTGIAGVGPQGLIGLTGPTGAKGDQGPAGTNGINGAQGIQGPIGITGAKGDIGPAQPVYPVSLVMDQADVYKLAVYNMKLNGRKITGPLSPGQVVTLDFDWSRELYPPAVIQQLYVGFAGTTATCVSSGSSATTGHATITLTTPATQGTHVIALTRSDQYDCVPMQISANPANAAYAAVTAVK